MMMLGDTTLTKVFVGGLAWETPKEAMRDHFQKYGEILEVVIIFDKLTGRSKGYGFVTFKDAEAAKRACEDPTPMINGRQANCNLASLGARRPRSSSAKPQSGSTVMPRPGSSAPAPSSQWYYPTGTPTSLIHQSQHYGTPYHAYGYCPAYIADIGYNMKGNYSGSYTDRHYSQTQMYASQGMVTPNAVMPIYPFYHFHHQSQTMGVPAQLIFHPPTTAFIPKPPPAAMSRNPNSGPRGQMKVQERDG